MALDPFSPIQVASWASVHGSCPMRYTINSADRMTIIFGRGTDEFEFTFDGDALRAVVRLGIEALTTMDAGTDEVDNEQP